MYRIVSRLSTAALVVWSLSACAGAGTTEPDEPQTGTASIALGNQGRATIVAGSSAAVAITVNRTGNFAGAVTVSASGLPAGITASSVTLTGSQSTGSLMLTAAANAPRTAVAASVAVSGSGSGVTTGTVYLTLSVTTP